MRICGRSVAGGGVDDVINRRVGERVGVLFRDNS